MISISDLIARPEIYEKSLVARNKNPEVVKTVVDLFDQIKTIKQELDTVRERKNQFNKEIVNLAKEEKPARLAEMKVVSEKIKDLEEKLKTLESEYFVNIKKIPNILSPETPIGKDENENQLVAQFGQKPEFNFVPKPYWELPIYKKLVSQEDGVKAMGARGYYLKGDIAFLQKVLMDYAMEKILKKGFELLYVPLMLNEKVLTGTGHLPDFDGQQYEIAIDENKSFYLIGSSEPSIMGMYMQKNLGNLEKSIINTCLSSCFRKEAGSYGRDQQGILRVHQFEKIEMVAICKEENVKEIFEEFAKINEELLSSLGLHFQKVEVCSGDMPTKHYRQQDYEAWFPSQSKYREVGSNGIASDFQNRGLEITYTGNDGKRQIPWGLNCTGMVMRTGLAILENFQTEDGRVKLPEVLASPFGKEFLE